MKSRFVLGMRHGIPIGLGYLSVSFGFGILAAKLGFDAGTATLISMTNLTSAGQAAGIRIMAEGGSYLEMALTQLLINLRYALMGISLSQNLDQKFTLPHRFIAAFGITDEIFAVASAQKERLRPSYLYGMILVAFLGWTAGTFLGGTAGELLPSIVTDAMGLALYGMFIAIVVPPAKKQRNVLAVVGIAALGGIVFYFCLPQVPFGFSVIICAVLASAAGALLFPVKEGDA